MAAKARIAILFHGHTRPREQRRYFIAQMARCWRDDGYEVISSVDPAHTPPADLLIMHVDLSVVPHRYLEAARRYPRSLNARIRDIRKTAISRNLVGADSDWDGPVIVKTNLNSAGLPEKLYLKNRGVWNPADAALRRQQYRVYPSISAVPRDVFLNRRYVVEKFLPERSGDSYCLRSYHFFGDVEECFLLYSDREIITAGSLKHFEPITVHPAMRAMREKMGFDYGKFDYVECDGEAVLLDANKTPGYFHHAEQDFARRRANGIRSYFSG